MLQNLRYLKLVMAAAVFSMSLQSQAKVLFFKHFSVSAEKLQEAGIAGIKPIRDEAGKVLYQLVDEGGNALTTFAYDRTSKEVLNQFKPSAIQKLISGTAQGTKGAGKIIGRKLLHFPAEAFTFFVALGAVQAYKLVFHYNENPAAYDTYLSSQTNAVGHVGFAAFMIANGLATEPLQNVIESKSARFLLPHFGMWMGMMASNIVHEVGNLPHFGSCIGAMMGGQATSTVEKQVDTRDPLEMMIGAEPKIETRKEAIANCDLAYEEFMKINWPEKGHEWAPSLFSLSASTVIGMVAESMLKKMGTMVAQGVIVKVAAINMALLFTPGGWAIKGATWAYKFANIVSTTILQEALDAPLRFFWVNSIDLGPRLRASNSTLGKWIAFKNKSGWAQTDQDEQFKHELERFKEAMYKWRQGNMESVLRAHSEWQVFLQGFSNQYRIARKFYMDFTSDVWKKTYELSPDYKHLMDRSLPLHGITPQGFDMTKDEDVSRLLLAPGKIQDGQLQTVANLNAWAIKYNAQIENQIRQMFPQEQQKTREILKAIASNDPALIGKAILQIKYSLEVDMPQTMQFTEAYRNMLNLALKGLGQPTPLLATGQGYLRILAKDPNNPLYHYDPFVGFFGNHTIPVTERLIMPMLTGPDVEAGQSTVQKNFAGFSTTFNPPMIRYAGNYRIEPAPLDLQAPNETKNSEIFNQNFWGEINGKWHGGGTLFDFLRQGGIRPSVLGNKESGVKINEFWAKYPERDLVIAYNDYQSRYEDIMLKMFRALKRTDRDIFNNGPIPNGLLDALETEYNVYLAMLDSQLTLASGGTLPEPVKSKVASGRSFTYEYQLLAQTKAQLDLKKNAWTTALQAEWTKTRALIEKIQEREVRQKDGNKLALVSHVTNKDFEEHLKNMDAMVEKYPLYTKPAPTDENGQPLTEEATQEETPDDVVNPVHAAYKANMNPTQAEVVQFTVDALKSVQREMLDYLQILNAVSYVDNFKGEALTEPMRQHCVMSFDKKESTDVRSNKGCYENPNRSIFLGR